MRNPYDVLGVPRDADQESIRKAYKQLARKYHPDLNKAAGAEQQFKEVNGAYDAVGDEEKRKLFDEFGEASTKPGFDANNARAWKNMGGGGGGFRGGPMPGGGGFEGNVDMEDFISSMFGGGASGGFSGGFPGGFAGGRPRERKGADQQFRMGVEFMTSVLGGEKTIGVPQPDGTTSQLKVRIPAGVEHGKKLRLKGQGHPPPGGGACGDLVLHLDISAHPILRRDGDDLEMDVPITVLEALRGASITVPTPTGEVKVKVPAGVASGTRLRLAGRGVQKTPVGDLYLVLRPTVPESSDPQVIEAAEKIEAAYAGDVRQKLVL